MPKGDTKPSVDLNCNTTLIEFQFCQLQEPACSSWYA